MARALVGRMALMTLSLVALAGCDGAGGLLAGKTGADPDETAGGVTAATSVRLVDRDVEAPEVFQVTDEALWDGRPSLGGVWVASPDAVDPERVILRNPSNGRFVIGALFRRERDNPGPALQISSDAAAALGLLAGQPGKLNVTALRREDVAEPAPDASKPILDAAETVETTTLDPVAVAGAAIDKAEGRTKAAAANQPALQSPPGGGRGGAATVPARQAAAPPPGATLPLAPAAAAAPAAKPASGGPLVQIGIFSVEANAMRAVDTLGKAGVTAALRREESNGKPFWSVTARGDAAALGKIKAAGFADAYVLKR